MVGMIATVGIGLEYLGLSFKIYEFWGKAYPILKNSFNDPYISAIDRSLKELEKNPDNQRFCKVIRANFEQVFSDNKQILDEAVFCENLEKNFDKFKNKILANNGYSCETCKRFYNNFKPLFVENVKEIIVDNDKAKNSIKEQLSPEEIKRFDELLIQFNVILRGIKEDTEAIKKDTKKILENDETTIQLLMNINEYLKGREKFENVTGQYSLKEQEYIDKIALLTKENEDLKRSKKDPLTNLYDRHAIGEIIDKQIKSAKEKKKPFSIIFIDIDGFKRFDTVNHIIGDSLLKQIEVLLNQTNRGDYVIRYNRDEFVIVTRIGTDVPGSYGFAQRLQREVEEFQFLGIDEKVTISCGVTTYDENKVYHENICKQLIFEASYACNRAKEKNVIQ
jgi:diguanylate cyclase (GGDEF)-like protein